MAVGGAGLAQRRLIAGAKDYILNWERNEKPTLDRMIDIVLADKEISSDEIEQIADIIFDIEGWLARCVIELNARTFARRAEEQVERERGDGPL